MRNGKVIKGLDKTTDKAGYDELKKRVEILEKVIAESTGKTEELKASFLRNLYHEIRTPMNAILGFRSLLESYNLKAEEKEKYGEYLQKSSQEFLKVLDDIVEASLIDAGLVKLEMEECTISQMMDEIHSFFTVQKHVLGKDHVVLLKKVKEENKNVIVQTDRKRLSQIITYLLSNAFKFTEKGVIEYGYTLYHNQLEFFVIDSGIGGLDRKIEDIFEPFIKLDNSAAGKKGLGLGLSTAKRLVELFGGKIWVEANRPNGSVFRFRIPVVSREAKKIKKLAENTSLHIDKHQNRNFLKVLKMETFGQYRFLF